MKLFKKAKKGFTLVELVVVIAVIAILSAVSVGAYFGITESANDSRCQQEAKAFHTALMVVAANPESGITLSNTGLTYAPETNDDGINNFGELVTAIGTETGIAYAVAATPTDNNTPTVSEVKDNSGKLTDVTYKIAGKTKNIDVVTGAVTNP